MNLKDDKKVAVKMLGAKFNRVLLTGNALLVAESILANCNLQSRFSLGSNTRKPVNWTVYNTLMAPRERQHYCRGEIYSTSFLVHESGSSLFPSTSKSGREEGFKPVPGTCESVNNDYLLI